MISLNQEPTTEEKQAELARVLNSTALQNSPMLQKLLQFLGAREESGHGPELSEWLIATTVFGRPKEFDSSTDTTVRTSVYRLRTKLREYYGGEGKSNPISIEIPKGHHQPVFVRREVAAEIAEPEPTALPESLPLLPVPVTTEPRRRPWPLIAGALFIAMLAGWLIGHFTPGQSSGPKVLNTPSADFWRAFAAGAKPVIIAYSNAELLQTDTRDLIRYDTGAVDDRGATVDQALAARSVANPQLLRGHSLFYEDGYTGTGEVQAAFTLTRMLTQLGIDNTVKRVKLLTSDDLKTHNVVLLGSTLENRAIADLRIKQGFTFELPLHSMWAGRLVDRTAPNSPAYTIERDHQTQALQVDYAAVTLTSGVLPDRKILVLGGLTTSGTQGAAEFMTSDSALADLAIRLHRSPSFEDLSDFETVLQVKVVRGLDPVSIIPVTARPIPK